ERADRTAGPGRPRRRADRGPRRGGPGQPGARQDPLRRAEPGLRRAGQPDRRRRARRAPDDRRPLPAAALGPAADAAPGAERGGPGDAGRHRGLRGDPGPQHRRRQRGGHLLHDVQAAAGREVPRRGLHHGALRDHGRRRGLRPAAVPPGDRQRRDHRRRPGHPGAPGVQRRLRLRPGDDGQLGVLRQHHTRAGGGGGGRAACRRPGTADPRGAGGQLEGDRAGAGRVPRRPGRRGSYLRCRLPAGSEDRSRPRLAGAAHPDSRAARRRADGEAM
ncbi:MAG: NADH-ubiquinone oxidoreductase chain E, partial [uncultured Friedmanniella sp.]